APPSPRAVPRPPKRGRVTPAITGRIAPAVPPPPDLSEEDALHAATFGRVDDEGRVWVREEAGEREVGQYPDTPAAEALAFYVRRYADLHAKIGLFEARLAATDLGVKEIDSTLEHLTAELEAPAAVGDLDALRRRLATLRERADARRTAVEAERTAAKAAAAEARQAMVEAAEKIAATDPAKMQWRPAGEQLRVLLDSWKEAQRCGPRLDRTTEDALWKRFSHARSTFDRERRRWFAELEKANAGAREVKERIVAEAEALATSTDWGGASAAYRDLMARWKSAGRANRKDDDALWARFRAAQDAFFAARDEHHRTTDAEFGANLELKLALLEEAERLVPVKDLAAAKSELRAIQDRWEKIGKVPRADVQRVEGRLRAVEQAVRDAEQSRWQRTNPETRARAEGAAAQLVSAIAALEADLDKARAKGDARKVAEIEESLSARRAWLEQVERAAAESRG
ncbi:ATPase, partial [Actinotalea fermentans ATCC 43279 = JCM 9966 = DSM 3133]